MFSAISAARSGRGRLRPAQVDPHHVQVVGVAADRRPLDRDDPGQRGQALVVAGDPRCAIAMEGVDAVDLGQRDGRLEVGQAGRKPGSTTS
jgi:hypothetical protein